MTKGQTDVPTRRELSTWRNHFGRLLRPNQEGTKLFGVDSNCVPIIGRSPPKYVTFIDQDEDEEGGFSSFKRRDGSRADFKLSHPTGNALDAYLTCEECDFVLGSNYRGIDESYSSPSAFIRKQVFAAEAERPDQYNAFELGGPVSSTNIVRVPVLYYKIPQKEFRRLRDL
jgi:hypothetical protein